MMTTEHPLWISYEQDLRRLLVDLDPAERAEVLAGVREHLHASLAGRPQASTADIQAVLTDLGPPEAVAQEAYDGHRPPAGAAGPRSAQTLARSWVPVVVTLLQVLGLLMVLVINLGWSTYSVAETSNSAGEMTRTVDYTSAVLPHIAAVFLTMLPMWIPVFVLAAVSDLWDRRHKLMHIFLLPTAVVLLAVVPDVGWALAGETGLNTGARVSMAVVLLGAGWILWRLAARGMARSRDLNG